MSGKKARQARRVAVPDVRAMRMFWTIDPYPDDDPATPEERVARYRAEHGDTIDAGIVVLGARVMTDPTHAPAQRLARMRRCLAFMAAFETVEEDEAPRQREFLEATRRVITFMEHGGRAEIIGDFPRGQWHLGLFPAATVD